MVWCPRSKLCYYVLFFSLRKQRVQFSNGKAGEKIWSICQSSGKFGRSYPNRRPMVWLPNTCATKKIYRSNPQFVALATTFSSLPSNTWIWAWVCHLHFIASPPILPSFSALKMAASHALKMLHSGWTTDIYSTLSLRLVHPKPSIPSFLFLLWKCIVLFLFFHQCDSLNNLCNISASFCS